MSDAPSGWLDRPRIVLAACAVVYLPFTLLGFGNDIDVPNLLRSGRSFVDHGHYQISRSPGSVVHEVATGVLDRLGGPLLVDLSSLGFALLCLWCAQRLLARDGARWPALASLVLASNPWFWIAATSLGDFTWSLGFVLAGAVVSLERRPLAAGLLFALAIGCRGPSGLLVAAWLVAQRTGDADDQPPWAETVRTAAVVAVLGALCFVPPWLAADRGTSFLDNETDLVGLGTLLGRWGIKNLVVFGVLGGLVLLAGVRPLLAGLGRWRSSVVVRFAVLLLVVTELLFLRFPFKPLHLLPALAALALLVGASSTVTRRWIGLLVAAQLVAALVGTTLAAPDVVDAARSGSIQLGITGGVVVTDVRCRLDDDVDRHWTDPGSLEAADRGAANAACQSESWRAK